MDVPRGVLVKGHRLKQDIISGGLSGNFVGLIDNLVDCGSDLESVRVHLLADLALESFPVERSNILILSTWWFLLFLSKDPGLKALEMD
jgi:hypothetical protein